MKIGPYSLSNQVILAPMAGVTDLPYRNLCRERGAGAAVAEMLTSQQDLWQARKSRHRQVQAEETGLRWIQILGNDPGQMAAAARACEQQGAHLIDINMGCPAKKVCRRAAGSALMQDEVLVGKILSAVTAAVQIPVTLKMRTGYSPQHRNAGKIAQIAEQSGIAALSLHGRTRACGYDVTAEYETAAHIRQVISIPLVVNGDITTPQRAQEVLQHTGADAVMIGRAALGNPWLFQQIDAYINQGKTVAGPALEELVGDMEKLVRDLHAFYGTYLGLRIARKHMGWYEEKFPQLAGLKKQFNCLETELQQLQLLEAFFKMLGKRAA